ncbi:Dynein light chain [Phytophthora cinnamomi]|uniref:Dynein light chain n=1 Tax=Phytophthora cinnamomi TaxID=4785 RepID=UPI00355AA81A|nr:Dynein light chain [Phytophthora cinnamomi]
MTTFTTLTTIHICGLLSKQNHITSERVAMVDGKRKNFTDADDALLLKQIIADEPYKGGYGKVTEKWQHADALMKSRATMHSASSTEKRSPRSEMMTAGRRSGLTSLKIPSTGNRKSCSAFASVHASKCQGCMSESTIKAVARQRRRIHSQVTKLKNQAVKMQVGSNEASTEWFRKITDALQAARDEALAGTSLLLEARPRTSRRHARVVYVP